MWLKMVNNIHLSNDWADSQGQVFLGISGGFPIDFDSFVKLH